MIKRIIYWSIHHRVLVLLATLLLIGTGLYSLRYTPVDAIPDLSDVQVIIKTSYPGQSPQVVEDQVTYPLSTAMLAVPGAKTVRGFSFYGDSYVYVIFNDQTDLYWARSRVLEYLSQVIPRLPAAATPQLGPDATGVGWIFAYALRDKTGQQNLSDLRALQDWFLKYELQTVEGVAEVAAIGGMVRQYQVQVDPNKLRAYGIPLHHVRRAIERGNQETGASVIEMAEAEYMISATGYIQSSRDLANIPLGQTLPQDHRNNATVKGIPLRLGDVAAIRVGPQMRRGIAELNGLGEVAGGVVIMRFGENAKRTIDGVKAKLANLKNSLPAGVEVVTVYDRSGLIERAIDNLSQKLISELLIVAVICAIFLMHLRAAFVAVITLPIGILSAFVVMHYQGINANIMSLGGIAIAVGAMTDGAIVLIENFHKHCEKTKLTAANRWDLVAKSTAEVGPPLFFSLLIITVSFLPVFILEAQEGRMFAPLAYTKTYAMAAAAGLAITLIPVLIGYFIRGQITTQQRNPINTLLIKLYQPALKRALNWPKLTLLLVLAITLAGFYPLKQLRHEFMPTLDEGDLMYMPTTYAGISVGKARELLQQTDKLIATVPEVRSVFGKVGRADTATDPAPLTMIETFIQLKPKSQWREGVTLDDLKAELDALVNIPGVSNAWLMPIKMRIDMLATGIKTPVGIKISGDNIEQIQRLGTEIEAQLGDLPGTASVYAEKVAGGRYLKIAIDREKAARFAMNIADIQDIIATAIGGKTLGFAVEGLQRHPINLRYPQDYRDSPESLKVLPMITPTGQHIALGDVADIVIEDGAPMLKSENARLNGWVYIDLVPGTDVNAYVEAARSRLAALPNLPTGYSLNWSGQYELMQRAQEKLSYVLPLTLGIITLLLYLSFRSFAQVLIILGTLPLALVGGLWLLYLHDFAFSVAVGVGFIALAGVAVEIGMLMMVYLNQSCVALNTTLPATSQTDTTPSNPIQNGLIQQDNIDNLKQLDLLKQAVITGASLRVRPIMMTVATIVCGLLPVLYGTGTGSEIMSRIAAPMVGGMASALLLSLIVVPVVFYLWQATTGRYGNRSE